MSSLGLLAEEQDLRNFVGRDVDELGVRLSGTGLVWACGGDPLLLPAMRACGFDRLLLEVLKRNRPILAEHSAAVGRDAAQIERSVGVKGTPEHQLSGVRGSPANPK